MKKLLNNEKYFAITVIVGSVILAAAFIGMVAAAINNSELPKETTTSPSFESKPLETPQTTSQDAPQQAQPVETTNEPIVTPKAQPAPQETPKEAPQQYRDGGHIPFTNNPVTAGEPESYIGTVGQCPFYEIVNEKGCTPPPDIECNADWSVCTRKEN